VQTGDIRAMKNGLGMIWVKCPLNTAVLLSKMEKVRIGWSVIRIEMLQAREKQCFRCWKFGHLKYTCKFEVDRTGHCYRCGSSKHKIKDCSNEAQCVICKE
ncbi:Gag-Pol polyprotein, partial [Camponotus floridanus]